MSYQTTYLDEFIAIGLFVGVPLLIVLFYEVKARFFSSSKGKNKQR